MTRAHPEIWHFGRPAIDTMEATAQRCEEAGFDGMSLTDSQNLSPDTYVALTLAARATKHLLIGPGVTNPLTRHPAVAAGAIAGLQQLSGGRAVFGIGRGDSALFNIGRQPVSPPRFESYVSDVQAYLRGETLDTGDYPSRLHWLRPADAKVPVDVAATGPRVISVGARHAERLTFAVGADPRRVSWAIEHATREAGPDRPPPSFGMYVNVCVHDDWEYAASLARPSVGIFAHFTGMKGATRDRVEAADQATFDTLGKDYDRPRHGKPDASHLEALTPEFVSRFAVIGPAQTCISRLRAFLDLGIERLMIIGPRPDQFGEEADRAFDRFAGDVLPALRAPG